MVEMSVREGDAFVSENLKKCDVIETECDVIEAECDVIETECDVIKTECDVIKTECDVIETESWGDVNEKINNKQKRHEYRHVYYNACIGNPLTHSIVNSE